MTVVKLFILLAVAAAQSPGPVIGAVERVPLNTVVPDYPAKARRERLEGSVEVCFNVNRRGHPYRIAIRRSSHRVFEKSAIRAVRASRYKPLPKSVRVPSIKTCRTFTFSLEKA